MTNLDRNIQKVHDFIVKRHGGAYRNSGWELCKAIGIAYADFRQVLGTVRSPGFAAEKGWTIPPVGQGRQYGPYAVVTNRLQTETFSVPGIQNRVTDVSGHLRGVLDAVSIALPKLRPGSPQHTVVMSFDANLKAMQANAQVMKVLSAQLPKP